MAATPTSGCWPTPRWSYGYVEKTDEVHGCLDNPHGGAFPSLEASLSFAPGWLSRPPFAADGGRPGVAVFLHWFVGRGETLTEYESRRDVLRAGIRVR